MNLFALFPPNFSQNIFGTFCKGLFSYWLSPPNSPPPKFFHKPFLLIYFSDFYYLTFPHRLFALNFPPDFFPKLFFKTFFPKPFFPGPSSWLVIQTFPPNFFLFFFVRGVGGGGGLESKTSQELWMLSNVTLNCQVAKIVMNSDSQLSEL